MKKAEQCSSSNHGHDRLTVVLPIMKVTQFHAHYLRFCYYQAGQMEEVSQLPLD